MLLKAMGKNPIVRNLYSYSTIWTPRCAQTALSMLSEWQKLLKYHYLNETVCSDSPRDLCHFIGRYIWEDPATFMVSLDRNTQVKLTLIKQQNETTKHSSFLSTYGYEFYLINKQPITKNIRILIQQIIIKNTTKVQPTNELQFKKGNKVYFCNKNFKTPGRNKKLDPIKDNPFVIEEILKKNNTKLQLLLQAQIH